MHAGAGHTRGLRVDRHHRIDAVRGARLCVHAGQHVAGAAVTRGESNRLPVRRGTSEPDRRFGQRLHGHNVGLADVADQRPDSRSARQLDSHQVGDQARGVGAHRAGHPQQPVQVGQHRRVSGGIGDIAVGGGPRSVGGVGHLPQPQRRRRHVVAPGVGEHRGHRHAHRRRRRAHRDRPRGFVDVGDRDGDIHLVIERGAGAALGVEVVTDSDRQLIGVLADAVGVAVGVGRRLEVEGGVVVLEW